MSTNSRIAILFVSAFLAMNTFVHSAGAAEAALQPVNLRCEYLTDPLGIGETSPRLGWMLESARRGDRQVAYRILVASSADLLAKDQGDLWDTGKVESDENAHVVYQGKPLTSEMACFWKVQVWSPLSADQPQWSAPARWTMGLLTAGDWHAKWIDSTAAVLAEAAKEPITIIHASYQPVHFHKPATATTQAGTASQPGPIDVTSLLAGLAKKGPLNIIADNKTMGGDPALDKKKELVVEYQQAGKTHKITIAEDAKLALPPLSQRLWYLRKSFDTTKPVKSAMLYATAMGVYELRLNGQRVGDEVFAPGWTDYNKRLRYQAYDVTSQLKTGGNAIAAEVGPGWYAGHLGNGGYQQYGTAPALLAELHITYADGSTDKVITDESWKIHQSPVLASDFMLGETHDAREEIAGWDQPALSETGWTAASLRSANVGVFGSQVAPPVRQTGLITPVKLTEPAPGHWTYDLGQNMVGVVRLKVSAPAGTVITLHHAEMLKPDGTVYTANLRGAPSVDVYTCKGGGEEIWQPQFTFHGFRYVQVTGLTEKPPMDLIAGVVLGSDTPRTGSFVCSDSRINQLVSNIEWGQRGNYLSVPTDCPQRDERLGWMGDAQVFVRTATCNADVAAFFTKWLVDVDDAQWGSGAFTDVSPDRGTGAGTPAWGDAGVICPWTIYMAYGDKRILERHLPAMTRWVEWCRKESTDLIRDRDRGADYGDWLSIKADTPKEMIGTAYFAYSTHLLTQSYAAVGNTEKAATYQKLFEDIKSAFNKKYVTADGHVQYTDAKGKLLGNTQCCYAMALKFELLPEALRPKAAQYLTDDIKAKDWHLSTGFVGVSYLLPTLTQADHSDVAYKLLVQDSFPSWLFSVKHGATTIWERWDGWTPEKGFQNPGMNSFNHYSLGSCGEWLYDTVAGITWDPASPGYKHIILRPVPPAGGELTSAKGTIGSNYGSISSGWVMDGNKLTLGISLPPNTTATVYVPVKPGELVSESGKPADHAQGVKFLRADAGANVYEVESGKYSFVVN
jgi:alpha-L-rhamnosidase